MLIFTAFQTCTMVEKTVLEQFDIDGYISLAVIYATFAICNWSAPSIISVTGPKYAMVMGAVIYCGFIALFLNPKSWTIYLGSALLGLAAAVLWTAQGSYLTINSTSDTISRNSGIFWALLQCSLVIGNMYVYFKFHGEVHVEDDSRIALFSVLTATAGAGLGLLLLLRNKRNTDSEDLINVNAPRPPTGPVHALRRSLELFRTREIILLSFTFAYTGFELTFFSGVYGTSVGHTQLFENMSKELIGLSGVFIGVGEILGGAAFGLFGKRTNRFGRDPIVLLGCIVHLVCFMLIFLNLPALSPIEETSDHAFFDPPNQYVAMICSFLLGLGDSSFNTQLYAILGLMFPEDSAPAFALFKFVQSLAAALAFSYCSFIFLSEQLAVLAATCIIATWTYNCALSSVPTSSGYSQLPAKY